jgi:membrane-bound lytic murein transglycosylase B
LIILNPSFSNNAICSSGAFGNFQFMPSAIKRYAIDYDNNNKIELKLT